MALFYWDDALVICKTSHYTPLLYGDIFPSPQMLLIA